MTSISRIKIENRNGTDGAMIVTNDGSPQFFSVEEIEELADSLLFRWMKKELEVKEVTEE